MLSQSISMPGSEADTLPVAIRMLLACSWRGAAPSAAPVSPSTSTRPGAEIRPWPSNRVMPCSSFFFFFFEQARRPPSVSAFTVAVLSVHQHSQVDLDPAGSDAETSEACLWPPRNVRWLRAAPSTGCSRCARRCRPACPPLSRRRRSGGRAGPPGWRPRSRRGRRRSRSGRRSRRAFAWLMVSDLEHQAGGSSIRSLILTRKVTASRPSMMRWS